jgi:hypothetical protein
MSQSPNIGSLWFDGDAQIFCNATACRYYFHEISTQSLLDDQLDPVIVTTPRHLDATASCRSFNVVAGGDGSVSNVTVSTDRGDLTLTIPEMPGVNATIFMTNVTETCGFGCSVVTVLETSANDAWFYRCNSTVSSVRNASRAEHRIDNRLATMASQAIALQGDEASSLVNNTDLQYQVYPAESVFGTPANGTDFMSLVIGRFSAGVIASAAEFSNFVVVMGRAPAVGSRLNVKHPYTVAVILSLIVALQLLLDVAFAYVANKVVVPHGDAIAVAEVLRPMTARRGGRRAISRKSRPRRDKAAADGAWIYSCRRVSEHEYDLHMCEEREPAEEEKREHVEKDGQERDEPGREPVETRRVGMADTR